MNVFTYLLFGLLVNVFFVFYFYARYKRLAPPIIIFFIAYFFHAYLDVFIRYGSDIHLNIAYANDLFLFNIFANFSVAFGAMLSDLSMKKASKPVPMKDVFTRLGVIVAFASLVFTFIAIVIIFYQSGRLTLGKGAFSYGGGGGIYRMAQTLGFFFYSLVVALFLHASNKPTKRNIVFFLMSFLIIILYSIMQFGRQTALFIVLVMVILYDARVSRLNFKKILIISSFFVLITSWALLRTQSTGVTNLDFSTVSFFDESGVVYKSFESLGKALPGQSVFSNTIEIMSYEENFFYGRTYLESVLRVLLPDFLTTDLFGPTPAFWYKEIYAPNLVGHGFDFSLSAEAYMNFGQAGFFVYFLIGLLISFLSIKINNSTNPFVVIWSAIIVISFILGFRNDSNALFTRNIYFIVPYLSIYLLFKSKRKGSS